MLGLSMGLDAQQNPPWWPAGAVFAADFVNDRYMRNGVSIPAAQAYRMVRASSKLADDSNGVWHSFGPNVLARTDKGALIEPAAENFIPNSAMSGARPSVTNLLDGLPSGWEVNKIDGSSINGQVLATGTWLGLPSITLRLWGHSTVNDAEIRMMNWANHADNMPVTQGQSVQQSLFIERIGGSADNVVGRFRLTEWTAIGGYVTKQTVPIALGAFDREEKAFIIGFANAGLATSSLEFGFSGDFDVTLSIAAPQTTRANGRTSSPILTPTMPSSRSEDGLTLMFPPGAQALRMLLDGRDPIVLAPLQTDLKLDAAELMGQCIRSVCVE